MHSRRLACFLLGVWLGTTAVAAWMTAEDAHAIDRLLRHPSSAAAPTFTALGISATRPLLESLAAEQSRLLLQDLGTFQLVLGAILLLFLVFGSRERAFSLLLVVAMIAVTAGQRVLLTPDSIPFWGAEIVKGSLGLVLAGIWVVSRRSGDDRKNVDAIDKTDHRHVDR
jgi:hypothetical protein